MTTIKPRIKNLEAKQQETTQRSNISIQPHVISNDIDSNELNELHNEVLRDNVTFINMLRDENTFLQAEIASCKQKLSLSTNSKNSLNLTKQLKILHDMLRTNLSAITISLMASTTPLDKLIQSRKEMKHIIEENEQPSQLEAYQDIDISKLYKRYED